MDGPLAGAVVGGISGGIAATAVDVGVLAFEEDPDDSVTYSGTKPSLWQVSVVPMIDGERIGLGVVGQF